ncbi:amidase [Mycobacteroides abscessus 5S-0921]|nr:amidase [Mycobacteroides abscessus 5S-1215]EIV01623.1 amidase [Mycobacteroides abscessus 5S-0921]
MTRIHAFTEDALGDLDATGVAERIASGEVTAAECAEAAIVRLERVNPTLNAVEFKDFPRARERAEQADAASSTSGTFRGVPTATKCNIHVAGMPLTEGSAAITPAPQTDDGPFARQFLSTGVIPSPRRPCPNTAGLPPRSAQVAQLPAIRGIRTSLPADPPAGRRRW